MADIPLSIIISTVSYLITVGVWVGTITVITRNLKARFAEEQKEIRGRLRDLAEKIKERQHIRECKNSLERLGERRKGDIDRIENLVRSFERFDNRQDTLISDIHDMAICLRMIQKNLSCDDLEAVKR